MSKFVALLESGVEVVGYSIGQDDGSDMRRPQLAEGDIRALAEGQGLTRSRHRSARNPAAQCLLSYRRVLGRLKQ